MFIIHVTLGGLFYREPRPARNSLERTSGHTDCMEYKQI